jgi:hypothetical protein
MITGDSVEDLSVTFLRYGESGIGKVYTPIIYVVSGIRGKTCVLNVIQLFIIEYPHSFDIEEFFSLKVLDVLFPVRVLP